MITTSQPKAISLSLHGYVIGFIERFHHTFKSLSLFSLFADFFLVVQDIFSDCINNLSRFFYFQVCIHFHSLQVLLFMLNVLEHKYISLLKVS